MPIYVYKCTSCDNQFEVVRSVKDHSPYEFCNCGNLASQYITPPMVFIPSHMQATGGINYCSPIDGKPITTMAQRRDDLARNDCIEYDPEMKKDVDRRVKNEELKLDKMVDETVDREIEKMPAIKKERLESEMMQGLTAEAIRL